MDNKNNKLKEGEVFFSVSVLKGASIPCFPKVSKNGVKYWKGDGIVIFKNIKKASVKEVPMVEDEDF